MDIGLPVADVFLQVVVDLVVVVLISVATIVEKSEVVVTVKVLLFSVAGGEALIALAEASVVIVVGTEAVAVLEVVVRAAGLVAVGTGEGVVALFVRVAGVCKGDVALLMLKLVITAEFD